MDRVTTLLLAALNQALAEPNEHRLYRSGRLPGLFPSRAGSSAEAARHAIQEGLLEVIRSEPRGKLVLDWVRVTPKAVEFVHAHESPIAAIKELKAALDGTAQHLPKWLAQLQQAVSDLAVQLDHQVQAMARRIDSLSSRVEQAITRLESSQPQVSAPLADLVPWANEALRYLDRRSESGRSAACPLSELFAAMRTAESDLTVPEFHNGLRRLFDRGIVRLLPHQGGNGLPEPEYALLDGLTTYYFATRAGSAD